MTSFGVGALVCDGATLPDGAVDEDDDVVVGVDTLDIPNLWKLKTIAITRMKDRKRSCTFDLESDCC